MIILTPGIFSAEDLLDQDIGTNGILPRTDEDLIISNPTGYGIPSYRISVECKTRGKKRTYKVVEI